MGVCPQHTFWSGLLPGDSREQVQRLIDRPECCGCVRNNHCTGQAERLVCGLDKLVEQASYFSQSIQDSCTLLLNCRDLLPSEVCSSRSLAKSKENSILIFKQQLLSLESGPVLAIMCQLRSYIQYIYCRLILIACSCKIIMGKNLWVCSSNMKRWPDFKMAAPINVLVFSWRYHHQGANASV